MIEKFTLPFPPSVNSYWRIFVPQKTVGKMKVITGFPRMILAKSGKQFRAKVLAQLAHRRADAMTGNLQVEMHLHPPTRRTYDADNYFKGPLDALTHAGVWEDDGLIKDLRVRILGIKKGGAAIVHVRPLPEGLIRAIPTEES